MTKKLTKRAFLIMSSVLTAGTLTGLRAQAAGNGKLIAIITASLNNPFFVDRHFVGVQGNKLFTTNFIR